MLVNKHKKFLPRGHFSTPPPNPDFAPPNHENIAFNNHSAETETFSHKYPTLFLVTSCMFV